MLNFEITKSLANERQHEMTHNAVVARLARRVRRNRRQVGHDSDTGLDGYVVLPAPINAEAGHALAA